MEKKIRTYTNFAGEKEEVEEGSPRHLELRKKLNDAGLYEDDNPNKPESAIPFSEYMDSEQYQIDREASMQRMRDKLKEQENGTKDNG